MRAKELPVARPGLGIDVGNPHVVVALADDDELEGLDLAFPPIIDPEPRHGANIEFVVLSEPLVEDGVGRIRMRVRERGSGRRSRAAPAPSPPRSRCGTGRAPAPNDWRVQVPGGVLGVRMFEGDGGEHVALSGPATWSSRRCSASPPVRPGGGPPRNRGPRQVAAGRHRGDRGTEPFDVHRAFDLVAAVAELVGEPALRASRRRGSSHDEPGGRVGVEQDPVLEDRVQLVLADADGGFDQMPRTHVRGNILGRRR